MTKRKVCRTQSTLCMLFSVKGWPFFPCSSAEGFSSSHFFTILSLLTVYAVFIFWLSSCSSQRKRIDSCLHLLSCPLSWCLGAVTTSVLSCMSACIQILTWKTSKFSAFFRSNCFQLKSRMPKKQSFKVEYFQVIVALHQL